MTDRDIKKRLMAFAERIFSMRPSEALAVKHELESFIKTNNITAEQMQEFAETGAGEELYMLTC